MAGYSDWMTDNAECLPTTLDCVYQQSNNWKVKSFNSWTCDDVLQWICNEATKYERSKEETTYPQAFSDFNAESLRGTTMDGFLQFPKCTPDKSRINEANAEIYCNIETQNPSANVDTNCDIFMEDFLQFSIPQTDHIVYNSNQKLSSQSHVEVPNMNPTYPEQMPSCLPQFDCGQIVISEGPVRRKPGRPKSSHTIRKKPKNGMGKLWEFLRNLLLDKNTCPSLIKWDNYDEGTFKFVESNKVAQLWGERRKNGTMNYEKLSRAIRYYYRSEILLPVLGKKLVYKFGPQATGWRTADPILL